jgi:hypothetical protein
VPEGASAKPVDISDHCYQLPHLELAMGEGYTLTGFLVAVGVLATVRPAVIKDKEARLDNLVTNLISVHGSRLKRFSLHRLPISLKALDDVCTGFMNLEQLFIVVEQGDLVSPWPRICRELR